MDVYTDFQIGVTNAMDPVNKAIREGQAITTLRSSWLHQRCKICGHTFRPGDEVNISRDGTVLHNFALLPCAGEKNTTPGRSEDTSEFFQGLDAAWPSPNLTVRRLDEGDPLLAPPHSGFRRFTCAVCGHTLRVYDQVILCPCHPDAPLCKIAIHRDPINGLHCWDDWKPGEYLIHCPATSRKLET